VSARRWVLATGNAGKLREFRALLAGTGIDFVAQGDFGVVGPEESATTFVENALLKARHAAERSGLPAIADDSGLTVDALGGEPGVRSARYAGEGSSDADNLRLLLDRLREVPDPLRSAQFHCVIAALRSPEDPIPLIAAGVWSGSIARIPAGGGGFGYDPVFLVPEKGVTAAELPLRTKNRLSHRAKALVAFREALEAPAPGSRT